MMMLDVTNSIDNLRWTVEHHFLHIQAQHDFMRAWAVQFELAYTDFRAIEMALQLSGPDNHDLLVDFAEAYEVDYKYQYAFAAGGLEGFNSQFKDEMSTYQQNEEKLLGIIDQIKALPHNA